MLKGIITNMNRQKKIISDKEIQQIDRMDNIDELKHFLNQKNQKNQNNSEIRDKINDLEYTNNNIRNQASECNLCRLSVNNNDLINFLLYPDRKLIEGFATYVKQNSSIRSPKSLIRKTKRANSFSVIHYKKSKSSTRKTKRGNSLQSI